MSDALLKSYRYGALLICAAMIIAPLTGWGGAGVLALAWIPWPYFLLPHFLLPLLAPGDRTLVVCSLVYGAFWVTLFQNYERADQLGGAGNDRGMGAVLLFAWAFAFAIGLLSRLGWDLAAALRRKQNARNAA